MSEIERQESASRFDDSMKRAVSRAKELAIMLKKPMYNKWAEGLDRMRIQGLYVANRKSQTQLEMEKDMKILKDSMS